MIFDFPTLIAHTTKTRALSAGTIVGSCIVSNLDDAGGPGRPVKDGGLGYSCISELRVVETILNGAPRTSFMKAGDTVRIEMYAPDGKSIFGAIDQHVTIRAPR